MAKVSSGLLEFFQAYLFHQLLVILRIVCHFLGWMKKQMVRRIIFI
jgi:hypothetical protein